jgi:putative RecB family exonuclease
MTVAELPELPELTEPPAFVGSLSPSRSSDFKSCPLRYRFRVIDRLEEPPSRDAARGTLVHAVLERLFDRPAPERTIAAAAGMVAQTWTSVLEQDERLAALFAADDAEALAGWLDSARDLLANYFQLEDPARLDPAERELYVVHLVDEIGLRLHGYVDRLDRAPDGRLRVVDYKTGRAPGEGFEGQALFQLKFYALLLWRTRGVIPAALRLIYLGDLVTVDYTPDERELIVFERNLLALWSAVQRATETGDWRPRRSKLCDWCSFQSLCPEFGGTPPPLPAPESRPPVD